jgi:asparagine synthase (glutamine-hydrolysing)
MCGIAGYVGLEVPGVLETMTGRLRHRGPDGTAVWHDATGSVHLGHTRLAIIDRAGGAQPMSTSDGRLTIVFNGEIYNAPELRAHLESRGHRFVTDHSDTEVLLHGYREWGDRLPGKLNGMWAFVICDLSVGRLFASRDRLGEKPLYYCHQGRTFLFSSELTAMRAHPACPAELDRLTLKKYFGYGFIPAPRTLLAGVRKLPAGGMLTYDLRTADLSVASHWEFILEPSETADPSAQDRLADELLDRLRAAVRRQLVADVPVGVLLSGGIDSSAIAALASEERGRGNLASFTIGFHERSFDETEAARRVACQLGTPHHTEVVDRDATRQILPRLYAGLDEPLGDASIVPTYALAQLARQHVGVALGGDGGDELFAGYDTFRALRFADRYAAMVPVPVHRAIGLIAARLPVGHANLSLDFKLKRFLRGLDHRSALWHPLWLAPVGRKELADLLEEPIDLEEIFSEAIALWDRPAAGNLVDRALQFYTRLYLPDDILTKVDRASMLHGLEVRSPFLDRDVVEFARRLPSTWKLRDARTKFLLKHALRRILPAETIERRKKGFGLPLGGWLRESELLPNAWPEFPGVHRESLVAAHHAHRRGARDHRQLLWCAHMLYGWQGGARV